MQLLAQQHAAELECRRAVERELQALRTRHEEEVTALRQKNEELVVAAHEAKLRCAVAEANAKAAEKAAKERETNNTKLEKEAAEWRKLATDLIKEQRMKGSSRRDD